MEDQKLKGSETLMARCVPGERLNNSDIIDSEALISEPPILQNANPDLDTVSLCTGIGGLDWGAENAGKKDGSENLKVVLASDIWDASQLNYPLNFSGNFLLKDMLDLSADEILERIGKKVGELSGMHAGCPCPGWSSANRKRNDGHASLLETNLLTFKYISLISQIAPKWFVSEQVNGMGDLAVINGFHELKMRFKEELKDYIIQCREIRTLYLGVPQNRTRWIFIGWRRDTGILPVFPKPIKGSLQHLTIGAIAPEIDHIEIGGSRILRKEYTEFFSTVPASENIKLNLKDGTIQKLSERPDLLLKVFGYPEDFMFHPDLSFAQIHRLIGNSVPPLVAQAVFAEIVRQLRTLR